MAINRDTVMKTVQASIRGSASYRSGDKVFRFYWHRRDKRLGVRIDRDERVPEIEVLAKEIQQAPRPCPTCRRPVPRDGKRKFCSDVCAGRARKARFYRRRAEDLRAADQETKEAAFVEAANALRKQGKRVDVFALAREMAKKRKPPQ